MCGIAGKLYFNGKHEPGLDEIKKMTSALEHRGPDDEGIFIDGPVGLGHRRLSIIDLSPAGHQPMPDGQEKFWISFNGEIYNFLELRQKLEDQGVKFKSGTDTEVIVELYKKYGADCLRYLRGMFAFAVWDKDKQELFVARDRVGKKPLKYYCDGSVFIFASELKAILTNCEVKKEVDWQAVSDFLTYQYVPHPATGFKNIFKLEPAHYLIVKSGGEVTKKRYWQLDYKNKITLDEEEWENKILENLRKSVKLRMISDVPLGAHLSGGIDSSMVVALMAEQSNRPVKTFSIGFEEQEYNELYFAKLVAKKYHTDHHEFTVKPDALEILPQMARQYEEPFGDASALPTWYLMRETRKHVTVALNGDGGDENFAGYDRYVAAKMHGLLKAIPAKKLLAKFGRSINLQWQNKKIRQAARLLESYRRLPEDHYADLVGFFGEKDKARLFADKKNSSTSPLIARAFARNQGLGPLDTLLAVDFETYLPDDLLVKVDMASMGFALEVRAPFLDHTLLELAASMPENLKMRGLQKKYLLKKIAAKFLPEECLTRPKQGFAVPLDSWFRKKLKGYSAARLLDHKFLERGFNRSFIESLLAEHNSGARNHGGKIWLLLVLSEWFNAYFP